LDITNPHLGAYHSWDGPASIGKHPKIGINNNFKSSLERERERERVNCKYVQVLDVDGFEQGPFGVEE